MKGKDDKGKGPEGSGKVCNQCGTCRSFSWLFPILLLAIALVPGWLAATWAKWAIVVVAVLMLIKAVKPCKMCANLNQ